MNKDSFIENNAIITITVPTLIKSLRLDVCITQQFTHYSRNFFQQLIGQGYVALNGITTIKPSTSVKTGDTIIIQSPSEHTIEPEQIKTATTRVSILYVNDHFLVIDKPAHLLVHPPSTKSTAITVIDWIKHNYSDIKHVGLVDRPGIVHRLDKETSGLLIIARTNHAYQTFTKLFKERKIHKTYLAIVTGHTNREGIIENAIGRDPHNRIRMKAFDPDHNDNKIGAGAIRASRTDYTAHSYFNSPDATLVELKPLTGRTHQIRVHMTALGHPLIGDQLYGKKSPLIDRHALHAHMLSFIFDNVPYSFTSEPPSDFQNLISHLSKNEIHF